MLNSETQKYCKAHQVAAIDITNWNCNMYYDIPPPKKKKKK